jgi:hypothetical protein
MTGPMVVAVGRGGAGTMAGMTVVGTTTGPAVAAGSEARMTAAA